MAHSAQVERTNFLGFQKLNGHMWPEVEWNAIGLGCPVEIEFALKARKEAGARHQLHLLQIRPQAQFQSKQADRFEVSTVEHPPEDPLRTP